MGTQRARTHSAAPPPISTRSAPRFRGSARRTELARAFVQLGADYDRLRPGYPEGVLDEIRAALAPGAQDAIDLGAGTGKLSWALVARGLRVRAVDPSETMLRTALASGTGDALTIHPGCAERTGLPGASADLVTAAQSWHWFDVEAASAEVRRLMRPEGVLALVWNTMDVTVPWVHRYARIMHAGDIQREDFAPPLGAGLRMVNRSTHRWSDARPTGELIDLADTRSYVAAGPPARRERVRANLDWYLYEHLGHAPGAVIALPYRTDLFLVRPEA